MSYKGDYAAGDTVHFKFTTRRFSSGAPYQLAGTPSLQVYKSNSTTQSTAGITLTVDFDSVTGQNHVAIDTSADGTFYADGNQFDVCVAAGTVDSVSVVGEVVGRFTLRSQAVLYPTTAGRKLDVSAGGEAGMDWANVGTPGSTVNLSATTVKTATDVETDTQDIQSRLPAALTGGGNMKADALAISGDTAAADNAESFFDGTGYAGTNNVIPAVTTVTTLTGLTAATVHADLDDIQSRLPAALTGGGNIKADALAINGSTGAASHLATHAPTALPVTFLAGGTTTTAIFDQVDGAAPNATNPDHYVDRVLIFTAPASMKGQICNITGYDEGTATATISQISAGPDATFTAVMV